VARALDLLGVRWLVTDTDLAGAGRLALDVPPRRLYERESAWPFVALFTRSERTSEGGCLDRLFDPAFDPARTVLVEGAGPDRDPSLDLDAPSQDAPEVLERRAGHVRVRAATGATGVLVVGEGFDEGWRARVDGTPASVFPAQCALLGIALGAGAHAVELDYRPRGFGLGLALGGVALAGVLTILWGAAGRRRAGTARLLPSSTNSV
jgi:hypothetical protein